MTEEELKQKKEEYVKAVYERLGELSKDSKETVAFRQELYTPEVVEQLERQRRWAVILGPLGLA